MITTPSEIVATRASVEQRKALLALKNIPDTGQEKNQWTQEASIRLNNLTNPPTTYEARLKLLDLLEKSCNLEKINLPTLTAYANALKNFGSQPAVNHRMLPAVMPIPINREPAELMRAGSNVTEVARLFHLNQNIRDLELITIYSREPGTAGGLVASGEDPTQIAADFGITTQVGLTALHGIDPNNPALSLIDEINGTLAGVWVNNAVIAARGRVMIDQIGQ
ncbi:MAG: hypothetical protein ACXU8A_06040 [Burkholderiaceae bacterium]